MKDLKPVYIFSAVGLVGLLMFYGIYLMIPKGDDENIIAQSRVKSNFSRMNLKVPREEEKDTSDMTALIEQEIAEEKFLSYTSQRDTNGNAYRRNDVDNFMSSIGDRKNANYENPEPNIDEFNSEQPTHKGADKTKRTATQASNDSKSRKTVKKYRKKQNVEPSTPNVVRKKRVRKATYIGWKNTSNFSSKEGQEVAPVESGTLEFRAITHGSNVVNSGMASKILIRPIETMNISGCKVNTNKIYTATVTGVTRNRLQIKINVLCNGKYKVFEVFDGDGDKGLFVESLSQEDNVKRNTAKEVGGSALNTIARMAGGAIAGQVATGVSSLANAKTSNYTIPLDVGKQLLFIEKEK